MTAWIRLFAAALSLVLAGALIGRPEIRTDLSFFLPDAPADPAVRVLSKRLRDGPGANLMVLSLTGRFAEALENASDQLANALRDSGLFRIVANGRFYLPSSDVQFLFSNRYLLPPDIDAEDFGPVGLRAHLERSLRMLASTSGVMLRDRLRADPTNRFATVALRWAGTEGSDASRGVWLSTDRTQAFLVAVTVAEAFDLDAQKKAVAAARSAVFGLDNNAGFGLRLTGQGVHALAIREMIERDGFNLSLAAGLLVAILVVAALRSISALMLAAIPLAFGVGTGFLAVQLVHGYVHAITLIFGVTLLGVAVDYPIHLMAHRSSNESAAETIRKIWATLRLGVITTAAGFVAMTLSDFPGMAQLGLFAMVGVVSAGAATKWLLPPLLPHGPGTIGVQEVNISALLRRLKQLRVPIALITMLAIVWIAVAKEKIWDNDLSRLSPLSEEDRQFDRRVREQAGAPDIRYIVAIDGNSADEVLSRIEDMAPALAQLTGEGQVASFDSAARYISSEGSQRTSLARLPDDEKLTYALGEAVRGLPFSAETFAPFRTAVASARSAGPLDLAAIQTLGIGARIPSLIWQDERRWTGLVVPIGLTGPAVLKRFVDEARQPWIHFVDLKSEAEGLVATYRTQALVAVGWGALAVIAALVFALGWSYAILRVLWPIGLSLGLTIAAIMAIEGSLSTIHLVSFLLVAGIGIDYALFFNRPAATVSERERSSWGVLICALTTICVFAVLAFSSLPVLRGVGLTVALGATLAFISSAAYATLDRVA